MPAEKILGDGGKRCPSTQQAELTPNTTETQVLCSPQSEQENFLAQDKFIFKLKSDQGNRGQQTQQSRTQRCQLTQALLSLLEGTLGYTACRAELCRQVGAPDLPAGWPWGHS